MSQPTEYRTIVCAEERLDLTPRIEQAREDVQLVRGWRWNHQGMERLIEPEELAEAVRLYTNATVNPHSRVRPPDRTRYIYWEPVRKRDRRPSRSPRRP